MKNLTPGNVDNAIAAAGSIGTSAVLFGAAAVLYFLVKKKR